MDSAIIVFCNVVVTFGLFFLFKNLLPSYFSEKGKNIATKEDIGDITKIVEGIKLSNSHELETIKTELGLVSKSYATVYDDERSAITKFFVALTTFYETNTNIPNEPTTPAGCEIIREEIRVLEREYPKLQIAHSHLKLFCLNENILKAAAPLIDLILKIKVDTQVDRFVFLGHLEQIVVLREQQLQNASSSEIQKQIDKGYEDILKVHKGYQEKKVAFHKKYHPLYLIFVQLAKDYLKEKKANT